MAKYINLELLKLDLIKEIDDLTITEGEDVLKYIIMLKRNRRNMGIQHHLNTMDEWMKLFDYAMENSGKCKLILRFKEDANDPTLGTCSSYDIRRMWEYTYETTESHTGVDDPDIVSMKRRYTFNELMSEIFSLDFFIRGIEFVFQIGADIYTGRKEFIDDVQSVIRETNFETIRKSAKRR